MLKTILGGPQHEVLLALEAVLNAQPLEKSWHVRVSGKEDEQSGLILIVVIIRRERMLDCRHSTRERH